MPFFRRRRPPVPPPPEASDDPVALVLRYHQRSKHDFARFAASMGFLDWDNQPDPFRRFEGAPLHGLSLEAAQAQAGPGFDALLAPGAVPVAAPDPRSLSRFLFHALALSAAKRAGESHWYLRVNPSSGNLHPTEGWLILPRTPAAGGEAGDSPGVGAAGASGATTPAPDAAPVGDRDEMTAAEADRAGDGRHGPGGSVGAEAPVPAGLWHYRPYDHALEQRAMLSPAWADALAADLPRGAFLVALSSIAWREAWKYGERAFRYVQHDVGHALGALRYGAALCGWTVERVPAVGSARLAELLGLDPDDESPEAEVPDLLAVVRPQGGASLAHAWRPPAGPALETLNGAPNALSVEHHPWPVIALMEQLCRAPEGGGEPSAGAQPAAPGGVDPAGVVGDGASAPPADLSAAPAPAALVTSPPRDVPATSVIRTRRSAVAMDGTTRLSAAAFFRMLAATHPGLAPAPFDALRATPRVHLLLFVHRVDDVAPGIYLLPRETGGGERLRAAMQADFEFATPAGCPAELPLLRLVEDDARSAAARVSCGQDIAGDGAFSLGMLAELEPTLRSEGPSAYPRLFWETGLIGQVLYLQARAAGVSATGIGCFFDDPVHALAGLRGSAFQSLYHFTVGGAVHDERIVDEPAYAHLAR